MFQTTNQILSDHCLIVKWILRVDSSNMDYYMLLHVFHISLLTTCYCCHLLLINGNTVSTQTPPRNHDVASTCIEPLHFTRLLRK